MRRTTRFPQPLLVLVLAMLILPVSSVAFAGQIYEIKIPGAT